MADTKITALTANTTPATTDIFPHVDDPSGTPVTKKMTFADLLKVVNGLTEDTAPDTSADYVLTYDTSASSAKKVKPIRIGAGGTDSEGSMYNGKIAVTVVSNNITVSLETLSGIPSSSDTVSVRIGNSVRTVSSGLTVTVSAGTNTFNSGSAELATKTVGYFVYLGYRTASSAVVVGFSRYPNARLYSDFSGTATNEKYAAFSTAPASTDTVVNIGYFEATLSAGAGYTWTVPTFTSANLIQRPTYSTNKLTFASTLTGFSGTPTQTAQYQIADNRMMFYLSISGTSNATGFTATLPFTPSTGSNDMHRLVDNGAGINGLFTISGSTITFYTSAAAAAWTGSGTKGCEGITKNVFI